MICCTMVYCTTALHCTIQYNTILYSALPYPTTHYSTALHTTLLHYTLLYGTTHYSTALHTTLLYYTLLYCTTHYSTALYTTLRHYSTTIQRDRVNELPSTALIVILHLLQWTSFCSTICSNCSYLPYYSSIIKSHTFNSRSTFILAFIRRNALIEELEVTADTLSWVNFHSQQQRLP